MDRKKKQVVGRPSKYRPEFVEQAKKLCILGATDREMSDFFSVSEPTFNRWKFEHPEFMDALKTAKSEADSRVVESLYQRALGYSHPDVHISNFQGAITVTPIVKHYPPDSTAAIFWLKNRQPDLWRDRKELTGADGKDLIPEQPASDEENARIIAAAFAKALHEVPKTH